MNCGYKIKWSYDLRSYERNFYNASGFIAQLVRASHRNREVTSSKRLILHKMPVLLLIFLPINSICCFQFTVQGFKCGSISMPRYLIHYSFFNCLSLKKRLKVESCNFFCGGWKSTKFVFSTFKGSLLAHSQVWVFINSLTRFILFWSVWRLLCSQNKLASSAK